MTLKECITNMQLSALEVGSFNYLDGGAVASILREHHGLWSMLYFGGDELIVFPKPGRNDDLAALFQLDCQDENPAALIRPDECDWEEIEGKRFIRAWWD